MGKLVSSASKKSTCVTTLFINSNINSHLNSSASQLLSLILPIGSCHISNMLESSFEYFGLIELTLKSLGTTDY